ncbi:MAG: xanthine dehydrogenase family protein molybdopterin-binding subunit, partial [Thermomicrobiales bacterium]
ICGPYRIQDVEIEALGVVTNKTPIGAYRGFGQPEATFPLERMVDIAAVRLGLDPADLRRRNLVRPQEMPYQIATGLFLDSGRYTELLDLTLQQLDYARVKNEVAAAQAQGRRLGVGIAFYIEVTNVGPSGLMRLLGVQASGFDTSTVRVEPSGHVRVLTGQTPMGQGVETILAQACADELGVLLEHVSVSYGDTLSSPYTGYASGGSRAAGVAGSSVVLTAQRVREKMRKVAAHLLKADVHEVEALPGAFQVRGKPEQQVTFAEVAKAGYIAVSLPEGLEPGLEATYAYDPPSFAVAYGVIAVVVEVSPETGQVTIRRIVFGHDCGKQLNPAIVRGQILGGVAQGIGAALYESLDYDNDGQPLVRTLSDFLMPTATEVPDVEFVHLETPPPVSVNGAKGAGESGIIAMPAAIINAIQDALGPDAPLITATPIWPETILAALNVAAGARADLLTDV